MTVSLNIKRMHYTELPQHSQSANNEKFVKKKKCYRNNCESVIQVEFRTIIMHKIPSTYTLVS